MRIAVLALVLLLSGPTGVAVAAPAIAVDVDPSGGATLGEPHEVVASLSDGGTALAGQDVTLEARTPEAAAFTVVGTVKTDAGGFARFEPEFDRNQVLRVSGAGAAAEAPAIVFPEFRISARTVGRNRVVLTQSFARERDVPVSGRTSFYLGRRGAETAPFARSATVRRRGDRYLAQATVSVPARYRRRFAFAACFRARSDSALGDAARRCPRRSFRF